MDTAFGRFQDRNYAFMNWIIKVNIRSPVWQKTVRRVLSNIRGVCNFKMNDYGVIEVSGMINPELLLKKLAQVGKRAELCWFQFGECSSNLYSPPMSYASYGGHGGYYDPYYHVFVGDTSGGGGVHPGHSYRSFAWLADSLLRRHAASGPMHSVPARRFDGEGASCCSVM